MFYSLIKTTKNLPELSGIQIRTMGGDNLYTVSRPFVTPGREHLERLQKYSKSVKYKLVPRVICLSTKDPGNEVE